MQQPENLPYGGTTTGEALNREVLTIEIREARDLLAGELMKSCEPYVVMTMYDSSGRPIGTRKTNVVAGSLNPYWMERFEFQLTQWDKEGGYVEVTAIDNRNNERLGYIRQPLFRLSETGAMEGWYYLDRTRHHSAALYFRMLIHPYRSLGAPAVGTGLASGISARQPAAATGIGVSGVGSRTPLGPTVYGATSGAADGFASPSGLPMGAAPATSTPAVGAPGMTPVVGPVMAREPGTAPLFVMRHRFWALANTYEVKDSQGLLLYRLVGNFADKLDDIRIADSTGHEVGYIREESSLISRVYRMPTYLISVYGTSAKLKRKLISINEPIFSLRPFNAASIHAKGNFAENEFSFYQGDTIIADVSKALAVPPGQGQYGIRVAPTFSNPLLILAATVAMDRIHDVTGMRPISGVYSDSKTLMSKVTRRGKKRPTVVTTTATPVATTTARTAAPVVSTTTTTTAAAPLAAAVATPVAPIVTPVSTPATPVAATPIVTPVTAAAVTTNPYAAYYDERGVPTTPVVSVTTVPRGESREGLEYYGTSLGTTGLGTTTAAATMQPRAELAARETLRQETEQQMMQAERIELAQMGGGPSTMATGGQQYAAQQQHLEKERDQKMTSSEIRQAQPVQIPIMGAGAFD